REQGVPVYGFGEQKTPESFRQACTRFIYTEDLPIPASATSDDAPPPSPPPARRKPSVAAPLIAAAITDLDEDGDGWVNIGPIGARLRNTYPDFSQRTYGYAKLSDLIRATGRFDVKTGAGNAMYVRVKPKKDAGGKAK
ncbi:MAG: OST-HTH/LOTUS domain-containing protein, partial [Brevundimonas sp.]